MILYLDTSDFNNIQFWLVGKKTVTKKFAMDSHESHGITTMLQQFLQKNGVRPGMKNKLEKIVVNKGPGSYTGVRIGVVAAQALSFAWGIPMQALETKKFSRSLPPLRPLTGSMRRQYQV